MTRLPARPSGERAPMQPSESEIFAAAKPLRLLGLRTRDARDQAVVAGESVFRVRGRVTVPQASNENDDASVAEGSDPVRLAPGRRPGAMTGGIQA